jgi:hypothetical protein
MVLGGLEGSRASATSPPVGEKTFRMNRSSAESRFLL